MKLSEVFEECARRIEIAWAQYWIIAGHHDPGGMCAHVTLRTVLAPNDEPTYMWDDYNWNLKSRAYEILIRACGGDGSKMDPVWAWNDAHERTQAEVVALFRALAATERAREGRRIPITEQENQA